MHFTSGCLRYKSLYITTITITRLQTYLHFNSFTVSPLRFYSHDTSAISQPQFYLNLQRFCLALHQVFQFLGEE